jgi:hypothetical protein
MAGTTMKPDEILLGHTRPDGKYNGWLYYLGMMFISGGWWVCTWIALANLLPAYRMYFCGGSIGLLIIFGIWMLAGIIGGVREE